MGLSTIPSPQKPHHHHHHHHHHLHAAAHDYHPAVITQSVNYNSTTATAVASAGSGSGSASSCPDCKDYVRPTKASKMRIVKKIKKTFGMTPRSTSSCLNNLPPLQFHSVHGDNVRIYRDGTVAKRYESFCKGIAFSARPVKVNERIYLKFSEISNNWSGVIRFGFTCNDPATLRNRLPNYACPDLTNRPGYWAKALKSPEDADTFCVRGNILFYYVNAAGDVHFGINGIEMGVFIKGVETRSPLWALIDIYGNCTAIELLDSRVCPHHAHSGGGGQRRTTDSGSNSAASSSSVELDRIQSAFRSMTVVGEEHPATATMMQRPQQQAVTAAATSVSTQQLANNNNAANEAACFVPMPFHRTKGRNVMLSADRFVATRAEAEFCQGYVFTARPVRIGEKIIVQVLRTEHMYVGALALGLTACDPAGLLPGDLPDDADMLLDRPEYWVVSKDVAATPNRGDEIMFCVQPNGEVHVSKNRGPATVVMHVDQSLQLWAFLDVYGSTQSVRMLSQAPQPQAQQMLMQQQQQSSMMMQQQQHNLMSPVRRLQVQLPASESMNSLNSQVSMHHIQQQQHHMVQQQQQHNRLHAEMQRKAQQQIQLQQQQQLQQQIQQHHQSQPQLSCMSASSANVQPTATATTSTQHMISVPTANGDMIQIQQGGTVLVVNLPPTQHSSVSDLSTSQASLAINGATVHTGLPPAQQITQAILHQHQQQHQQHLQQSGHLAITLPSTRVQSMQPASCGSNSSSNATTTAATAASSCAASMSTASVAAPVVPVQAPSAAVSLSSGANQSCASAYPEPVDPQNFTTLSQWHDAASAAAATNASLTAGAECTICYENPIDSVLYMCGHMCMCYECAIQQWRGIGGGHCPLCRAVIRDVIRTYKS